MDTQTRQRGATPVIDWFEEPYVLRDVNGDKIGDIVEINPDFIVAESDGGFLGLGEHRRYFVPRSYLTGEEGSDWRLTIRKDEIEGMNWSNAPTGSTFATEDWKQMYGYTEGAEVVDARGAAAAAGGGMRMVRFEEDLEAQAVRRQAGEVTIRKDVVEEVETVQVPVRHEEVRVERRPVTDATAAAAGDAFTDSSETISVPVMREEVEVRKVARPVEEVVVSKDSTEETRQVSDTVRKERFDIQGDEGLTEERR